MAQKRDRESSESAAPGAKKPRIDKDEDEHIDEDEEMLDAPYDSEDDAEADDEPASDAGGDKLADEIRIPRIQLEGLDYDDKNMANDLVYDNNGSIHPNYGDEYADPTVAVPKGPIPKVPKPKLKSVGINPQAKPTEKSFTTLLDEERKKIVKLFKGVERLHGGWIGVEGQLGEGGQGCARLFVKVDDRQRIIERIVVKDAWSKLVWDEEDWWEKGRFRCDPRESITHKLMSLPTPENWERHIVQYTSHSFNPTWHVNRTYMEYCEGGDLESLRKAQDKKYRHVYIPSEADPDSEEPSERRKSQKVMEVSGDGVPESFVWYYLKQMAIALHRMENIPLKRYKRNFAVHQDIKPNNIFMTKPDPTEFPRYPICKIGDFGSARITYKSDNANPFWNDPTTPGYVAPEMDGDNVFPITGWELSNATNVWQIARTIVALMRLKDPEEVNFEELDVTEEFMDSMVDLDQDYSDELLDLLTAMLCTDPDKRPKPKDILNLFYDNEEAWKSMSMAPSCNYLDQHPSWLHWSPSEKNQINDFFADIPPLPKVRKARKAMIGALPVPGSSDDDDDAEEEEDEADENEEGDDEVEEDPKAVEAEAGGNIYEDEEDRAKDYDDDPMSGLSGSSLSSGSSYQPSP